MVPVGGYWWTIATAFRDAPHNYIELDQPIEARYIRYRHHYVPGKNLAWGYSRVRFGTWEKTGYGKRFYGSA